MVNEDLIRENIAILSYIGDAAYELIVRKHVIGTGITHADRLHIAATKYVRASAQARVIKDIFDSLTEEEKQLVKRARNKRISTKPKNADPVEYKWATAFEALLGYYCVSGQEERLESVAKTAIDFINRG
ncbi:mini-ribonuclease 3 [Clostridia bacterium]|nr:mini-ribonuclease 3 [Clostridia bacterium]